MPVIIVADDPWPEAWRLLRAYIETGATEQEVTAYAQELGRGLPCLDDPLALALHARAIAWVTAEILGGGTA